MKPNLYVMRGDTITAKIVYCLDPEDDHGAVPLKMNEMAMEIRNSALKFLNGLHDMEDAQEIREGLIRRVLNLAAVVDALVGDGPLIRSHTQVDNPREYRASQDVVSKALAERDEKKEQGREDVSGSPDEAS